MQHTMAGKKLDSIFYEKVSSGTMALKTVDYLET